MTEQITCACTCECDKVAHKDTRNWAYPRCNACIREWAASAAPEHEPADMNG